MARRHKVVWHEGMALDPHHFQQWDRYAQGTLNARLQALARYGWGLAELEIDREGVANGQFSVLRCRGVTPDGLPFNCPDDDPLPETRTFDTELAATDEKKIGVLLAIPLERVGGGNTRLEGQSVKRETRFVMDRMTILDDNTGVEERSIGVGRPNFSLRFSTEQREQAEYSAIKIAEVELAPDGKFMLSKRFIPPCLSIAASENLARLANELLQLLIGKSVDLTERRRQQPTGQIEYTAADIDNLWRLQTLNTFIPLLIHHLNVTRSHPETLYATLLMLAGQLTTFSTAADVDLRDFRKYDHNNLTDCFIELDANVRKLLEGGAIDVPKVPLEKRAEGKWVSQKLEDQLLQTRQFYLMCSGDVPERKVIDELPGRIKIAAPEIIDALIAAALPGLGVSYMPRPPVGLPFRAGLHYFRFDKTGPHWEKICQSHKIAIFVSAEFASLKIELIAVKEG
jgi:type VI secretion system protein ImpJ